MNSPHREAVTYSFAQNYEGLEDKQILWEMIKLEIRTQTIPSCVMNKRQMEKTERDLNKQLTVLFEKVNSGGEIENETWQEYSQIKLQLDNLERGVIIISKAQWVEEGEKTRHIFWGWKSTTTVTNSSQNLKWETV